MVSLVTHLIGQFTDTSISPLVSDKAVSRGTRLLFDFSNVYCNPNPVGPLQLGAEFKNLVDGAPTAKISGASTFSLTNNGGARGITAPQSSSNGQIIDLGNSYSLHASSHSFVALVWVKIPSTVTAAQYQSLFQLQGSNNQNTMFSIDAGADGKSPRVVANNQNNSPVFTPITGFTTGSVHQIGVAWRPGFVDIILDGAIIATNGNSNPALLDLSAFNTTAMTTRQGTTMYRMLLEDVVLSGRTVAQAVASDYSSAFSKFNT